MVRFYKRYGWYGESYRHSLAARGISTRKSFASSSRARAPPFGSEFVADIGAETVYGPTKIKTDYTKPSVDPEEYERLIRMSEDEFKRSMPEVMRVYKALKIGTEERAAIARRMRDVQESQRNLMEEAAKGFSGTEAKIVNRERYERAALANVRSDVMNAGDLAKAGNFEKMNFAPNMLTPEERTYLKNSLEEGIRVKLTEGQPIPFDQLKAYGFTEGQISAIQERMAQSPLYKSKIPLGSAYQRRRAWEVTKDVAEKGEAKLEEFGGKMGAVAKQLTDTSNDPRVSNVLFDDGSVDLEKEKGMLNFWNIAGLSGAEQNAAKRRAVEEKAFSIANRAERESSTMYDRLNELSQVDFSPFAVGEAAYKRGDLEGMRKSIRDLQAEKMRVNDKLTLVSHIRRVVLSDQNLNQTVLKENMSQAKVGTISNPLLGGDPGSKLNDQVNRVSKVSRDLQKKSDMLSQRISLLNQKYNRVAAKATIVPKDPEKVQIIEGEAGGMLGWRW